MINKIFKKYINKIAGGDLNEKKSEIKSVDAEIEFTDASLNEDSGINDILIGRMFDIKVSLDSNKLIIDPNTAYKVNVGFKLKIYNPKLFLKIIPNNKLEDVFRAPNWTSSEIIINETGEASVIIYNLSEYHINVRNNSVLFQGVFVYYNEEVLNENQNK